MAERVFEVRPSLEDSRPFYLQNSHQISKELSRQNYGVLRGSKEPRLWTPREFTADKKGAATWDYFMLVGTSGAFSQRAVDALGLLLSPRFVTLPARIEGAPFFFLHPKELIDCLNVENSQIEYFDDECTEVMEIERYVFHKARLDDPMIFSIPQIPVALFCTESVPKMIEDAGLRGFGCQIVDGLE